MKDYLESLAAVGLMTLLICPLTSCTNMNKQDVGTLTGGAAGALLGSTLGQGSGRMIAIAAGTLAGAYIGGAVGKNMDDNDRMQMSHALSNNAIGEPAYWHNQRTGARYEVQPVKNVTVQGNRYCREYRTVADINGQKQTIYGTACHQPDGSWKVVK